MHFFSDKRRSSIIVTRFTLWSGKFDHVDFFRKSARDKQTGILIEELKNIESPLIVMGDLNSRWDQKRSHVQQFAELAYSP